MKKKSHSISDQSRVLKKNRDLAKILVCFVTAITLSNSKTTRWVGFHYKKKVCFTANPHYTMKDTTEWYNRQNRKLSNLHKKDTSNRKN